MAFQVNNPTLKSIIDFLKNQLSSVATDTDISVGDTENWYGRKNGVWSLIQGGGGGGESTNIGDEVYTDGGNLIIKSASTEVKDFFGQIANDFNDALSYSTGNLVMYNKELYRFTSDYIAGSGDSLTTHAVTTTIDMGLQQKAPINNPIFTGTPQISMTPTENSNNHEIADTAYVDRGLQQKAPIASPTFTGTPLLSTTPAEGSNNYEIANTAYVDRAVSKMEVLKYTASGIADNNRSFNVTGLESDMVPLTMDLSNPSVQTGDWTISTTTNNFTITGSITGNTNADFYFVKTR